MIKYDNYFIVTHLFTKQVQIYKLSIELKAIDGCLWKSEKFEDIKGVIKNCKSKKDIQYND